MTTALLQMEDVHKAFAGQDGPVHVLNGLSLRLGAGETLALTGESGGGKSTALHLAGGLDQADSGKITVAGQDLSTLDDAGRAALRRDRIGVVFQQFNLIPSLTVKDNISFQARLASKHDPAWCAELLARLGLTEQAHKFPEQLSGGQQQRVAIGRALAGRPALVLADEPTGNLDEAASEAVLGLMLDLVAETKAGLLIVTHSANVASAMSRRLHLALGKVD